MIRYVAMVSLLLLLSVAPAVAAHEDTNATIENLKARIEALEAANDRQVSLFQHLKLSGVIELEANWSKTESEDPTSDLVLATALLSTEAKLNDQVGGHVILLYEEGGGGIDIDEAVISLASPKRLGGLEATFTGGQFYLPFGWFESHLISDPLTLELGEINDTAVQFSLAGGWARFSLAVFNGETDAAGDDDVIDSVVAAVAVSQAEYFDFGASWLSDLAESDNGLVVDAGSYADSVAGFSAYASVEIASLHLLIEYLGALESFNPEVVAAAAAEAEPGDLTGRKPSAVNLELALEFNEELEIAARYEQAHDFQDDVVRYGIVGSYGLFTGTVLALEYLYAETDVPESANHTVTAQLALEF